VKLAFVIVVASIARENVAVGRTSVEIAVAPSAGVVEVTVGGAATVVNVQVTAAASGTPAADLTVVSSFAV
jgi:hypothetical protein